MKMQDNKPFIDLVPPESAEGPRKALYDDMERIRGAGRISNLFRAYGAFPELGQANFDRLNILLEKGTLSSRVKEAVMTALAVINHCDYCVSFHGTQMLQAGATQKEIQGARDFDPDRIGLSDKERALFEYAMKANGDAHSIELSDVAHCKQLGATDAELVEIFNEIKEKST